MEDKVTAEKTYRGGGSLKLYEMHYLTMNGAIEVTKYAYGEPWVEQALFMNDVQFNTPEEAKAWWFKTHGGKK